MPNDPAHKVQLLAAAEQACSATHRSDLLKFVVWAAAATLMVTTVAVPPRWWPWMGLGLVSLLGLHAWSLKIEADARIKFTHAVVALHDAAYDALAAHAWSGAGADPGPGGAVNDAA